MKFVIEPSKEAAQPFYFNAVADNGKILAHSENYTSKANAQNAIDVIKAEAATATVEDNA